MLAIDGLRRATAITFDGQLTNNGQIHLETINLVDRPCPSGRVSSIVYENSSMNVVDILVPRKASKKSKTNGNNCVHLLSIDNELS
jgi:hypothetical protein